jgi:rare lipoprotein A
MIGGARAARASGLCLLMACSGGVALVSSESVAETVETQKHSNTWRQVGLDSWYGTGHHGKRTASGTRFDMNAMTAAHRSLPLGTMLRVENLANGRSIVVLINDRGPFVGRRIIDLSMAAARRIDLKDRGTGQVALSLVAAR